MRVLGIETSCDETGVAIYDSGRGLLADALYSQVALHAEYGGVVPELASRDHVRKTLPLVLQVLEQAGITGVEIEGVAYTAGPGLIGALLVGVGVVAAWQLSVPVGLAMVAWGLYAVVEQRLPGLIRRRSGHVVNGIAVLLVLAAYGPFLLTYLPPHLTSPGFRFG